MFSFFSVHIQGSIETGLKPDLSAKFSSRHVAVFTIVVMGVGMAVDSSFPFHGSFACGDHGKQIPPCAQRNYTLDKLDWQQQFFSRMKAAGPFPDQIRESNYSREYSSGVFNLFELGVEAFLRGREFRNYGPWWSKIQVSTKPFRRSGRFRYGLQEIAGGLECRISRQNSNWRVGVFRDDSTTKPSVHFIGIGGSGLSALAFLALQQGLKVSGSDATPSERLELLKEAGARVYVGHAAKQLVDTHSSSLPDAVVVSSAIPSNNEEVQAAQALGVPIYKRAEWLGRITDGYELLAIAGSHGKSTTTAMLATVLNELEHDITAIVGAEVPQFPGGGNAIFGSGQRFVLEADEYDGCFLGVAPSLAVVTSVDWEHVDIFPDEVSVRKIFRQFVQRIKPGGTLVLCGDSAGTKLLSTAFQVDESEGGNRVTKTTNPQFDLDSRQVVTYGLGDGNDWQAILLAPNIQGGTDYVAVHSGRPMARVTLQLPGTHNVLNSLAVIVVASLLASQDIKSSSVQESFTAMMRAAVAASEVLAQFVGVRRRFELVGKVKGCVIFDDYAHHPTEVRAVLQAARQRFDQQPVWVVFQPHTYSRLAKLLHDFAPAFSAADRVIITEVYAARDDNTWNISGADLANAITGPPAVFVPTLEKVVERLSWELMLFEAVSSQEVVLLTLGAGDITEVGPKVLKILSAKLL